MSKKKDALFTNIPRKELKNTILSIRVTQRTKDNLKRIADKYKISQSDVITALIEDVIKKENNG